jgi:hypothetical protein
MEELKRNLYFDKNIDFELLNHSTNLNKKSEYLKIINFFSESDFNLGNLVNKEELDKNNQKKINIDDKFLMFRYIYKTDCFYTLFYELNGEIYISKQSEKEIIDINSNLNPWLDFSEINSLLNFLQKNLFSLSKDFLVFKNDKNNFFFESLIGTIKIKWKFSAIKLNEKVSILKKKLF